MAFRSMSDSLASLRTAAQQATYEKLVAAQTALEDLNQPMKAYIETFTGKPPEQRTIFARIEPAKDGRPPLLRFLKAITGYEAYHVDQAFCDGLIKRNWAKPDEFWICAGTPGRWNGCMVKTADVITIVERAFPSMMNAARERYGARTHAH